ncbi:MAG: response regulator [Alphaproteobacteria bacterium]|jgi:CheY-like chemotaxis protein|nr:response regulator [Alphaproteobacteria bacterium]MBT4710685.1 response regulator [Alphaproteobacteria bacterium]MBT5859898.1 response regulator [Alphaproteobacteria bacterium]
MKITIVDDDMDLIAAMTAILEAAGHDISSEATATTAISHIVRRRPDCVLTDLMMAQMNGLALCEELRAKPELGDLKIIVVSGQASEYWQDQAQKAGADGYIVKPIDVATFASEVEQIVGG